MTHQNSELSVQDVATMTAPVILVWPIVGILFRWLLGR
jgi:hypothetical protein